MGSDPTLSGLTFCILENKKSCCTPNYFARCATASSAIAKTILTYANWELNKDGAITLTHCEMVQEILSATHRIFLKTNYKYILP